MVLVVNSNLNKNTSRTNRLTKEYLNTLNTSEDIIEIDLESVNLPNINSRILNIRNELIKNKQFDNEIFRFAKLFAQANTIIISAPYWDLSYPALLKTFIEYVCVNHITFKYSDKGEPVGLCNAKKLIYITTSGGYIGDLNLGYDYIKSICSMFGIYNTEFISVEGLDIVGNNPEELINNKIIELRNQ